MSISLLPSGPMAQFVSQQAKQFLINQAITTALGTLMSLVTGHTEWLMPWILGSMAGFASLILGAWSTVWTLGASQSKSAVIAAFSLIIARWTLIGGLLLGGGVHTAPQVGVALLACFGYNYLMPVRWLVSRTQCNKLH